MDVRKKFRTQEQKDAAIARLERAVEISEAMVVKLEELYHKNVEELKAEREMLERMKAAPID